MNIFTLIGVVVKSLLARRRRTMLLVCGVAVGAALLIFLSSFCLGIKRILLENVVRNFPATEIEVKPGRLVPGEGKPAAVLTPEIVRDIKAMPGVESVLTMTALTYPSMMSSQAIGLESECAVFGIERKFIEDDLPAQVREMFVYGQKPVPAVISTDLVELYNASLAESMGLPMVSKDFILGQKFNLFLGVSVLTFGTVDRVRCEQCVIVGTSKKVPVMGVTVPAEYVEEWQEWYYKPLPPRKKIFAVNVRTHSAIEADKVAKSLSSRGLRVTSGREVAEKVSAIARMMLAFLAVIGAGILFVVGTGIMNGFAVAVMDQWTRIGILRASGARRRDVLAIFLGEAVAVGIAGAVVGALLGIAGMKVVDWIAYRYIPPFPYKPESFFVCSPLQLALVALFVAAAAGVSGLPPALRAANVSPAEALRGG